MITRHGLLARGGMALRPLLLARRSRALTCEVLAKTDGTGRVPPVVR